MSKGQPLAEERIAAYRFMHGFVVSAEAEPAVLLRRLDGQERYVSMSGGPIYDAENRVVGGVVVLRDVTRRHHLCQRTEQALEVVLDTAEALVQMPAEGASSLAAKSKTVLQLLQSIPPLLEGHYAALFTQKPGDESFQLVALVDDAAAKEVLANYLSNALKYSPEEAPVDVGLEDNKQAVLVWVHDAGPGVAASEQEQIWDRFYRAPGTAVQSGSGIGLGIGLYISKTLIERHGGQVGPESAPGQGATFWFTLPRTPPGEQA